MLGCISKLSLSSRFSANLVCFHQHSRIRRHFPGFPRRFINLLVFKGLALCRTIANPLDFSITGFVFINIQGWRKALPSLFLPGLAFIAQQQVGDSPDFARVGTLHLLSHGRAGPVTNSFPSNLRNLPAHRTRGIATVRYSLVPCPRRPNAIASIIKITCVSYVRQ